jgi:hypothetical protein
MGVWSRELVKPTTIAQLKMDDVCIFCNIIEIFLMKKSNQNRKGLGFK